MVYDHRDIMTTDCTNVPLRQSGYTYNVTEMFSEFIDQTSSYFRGDFVPSDIPNDVWVRVKAEKEKHPTESAKNIMKRLGLRKYIGLAHFMNNHVITFEIDNQTRDAMAHEYTRLHNINKSIAPGTSFVSRTFALHKLLIEVGREDLAQYVGFCTAKTDIYEAKWLAAKNFMTDI